MPITCIVTAVPGPCKCAPPRWAIVKAGGEWVVCRAFDIEPGREERTVPYIHRIRVRYGECDQQGVVFNPNYMVYMDDASENWVSSLTASGNFLELGWDWMVVRSTIEWQAPAHHGETLSIDVAILRYGSTSFEIGFIGKVGERAVFKARSVCVSVKVGTTEKFATPDHIKALLGPAVDWDVPA